MSLNLSFYILLPLSVGRHPEVFCKFHRLNAPIVSASTLLFQLRKTKPIAQFSYSLIHTTLLSQEAFLSVMAFTEVLRVTEDDYIICVTNNFSHLMHSSA